MTAQVFPVPPATGRGAMWFLVGLIVFMLALALLFAWIAWSTRNSRAEVTPEGLALVGDLWGRTIPRERFDLDAARVLDLRAEPELQPRSRRMGSAIGGYASGWFRLRNGEKALLYLTDRRNVAYLPTHDGYSVLLSSHEPERLIAALRGG